MLLVCDVVGRVIRVVRETADATTLRIEVPEGALVYRAGQAVAVDPHGLPALAEAVAQREHATGQPEAPRFYSLATHPLERGYIELTVKEEPPRGAGMALVSPYLVRRVREGDSIPLRGPFGVYTYPDQEEPRDAEGPIRAVVLLGAGSGVVPNRALLKYALAKDWPVRLLVVLQNRTPADVIYAGEWEELARQHPDRVRLRHVFSRGGGGDGQGHVDRELLARVAEGWLDWDAAIAFVCGPNRPRRNPITGEEEPGLIDAFAGDRRSGRRGIFAELGVRPSRIRKEMW